VEIIVSDSKKLSASFVFSHPIHFLSFGFGSGLAPKAPGTFGTLAAIPIFLLLTPLSLPIYLAVCILLSIIGIYWCGYSAKALNTHDHPGIVWDEICGYLIAMTAFVPSWQNIIIGFCLFRLFDILKPWPIKWADKKVAGGFGIMLDDIIAGILAWCCLYAINYLDWL
jgi:phosphatidylglycerophosphatase A